ncbi:hypothetical protein MKX78_10815 [Cytobacillus sp. FSL R5-0569]|uniref:hypothetical protein n=1 Tax=Cytobacillus sp. FSL R5-0569 TaxID=2921649 RepID=UPI0030F8E8E7
MKRKATIAILAILVVGISLFGIKFYKDYKEFSNFRAVLDEAYIPLIKETADYFTDYTSFTNELELSEWKVNEGFDRNIDLNNQFEEAEVKILSESVEYENAQKLKENVLETISMYEVALDASYNETMDSDEYDNYMKLLSFQIEEMNEILEEH